MANIEIDDSFNFNNIYFRMLHISLARTLNRRIRWINYFTGEKVCVVIPMYLSFAGSERFLLDSFLDDVTDKRVELNTDQIPRGIITPTSFVPVSEEFSNPNIYIPKNTKIRDQYAKIITKVKAIPITASYDIEIRLDSEIDVYKCSEKLLDLFFNYYNFNMDYFGIKIDNILELPDDKTIQLPRDNVIGMDSENIKSIKFSLNVKSNYPSWRVDTDEVECEGTEFEDIKRSYWKSYLHDKSKFEELENLPENPNDRTTEDFNIYGDFVKDNPDYNKLSSDTGTTEINWS